MDHELDQSAVDVDVLVRPSENEEILQGLKEEFTQQLNQLGDSGAYQPLGHSYIVNTFPLPKARYGIDIARRVVYPCNSNRPFSVDNEENVHIDTVRYGTRTNSNLIFLIVTLGGNYMQVQAHELLAGLPPGSCVLGETVTINLDLDHHLPRSSLFYLCYTDAVQTVKQMLNDHLQWRNARNKGWASLLDSRNSYKYELPNQFRQSGFVANRLKRSGFHVEYRKDRYHVHPLQAEPAL